jgi:nitrous oxidase accessory protein
MTVADARFAGELVTKKGVTYVFDDLECLATFALGSTVHAGDVRSLWVNDFLHPERRLDAKQAQYWRNEKLRSPMSSGFIALAPGIEADSFAQANGAQLEDWTELIEVVRAFPSHRDQVPVEVVRALPQRVASSSTRSQIVVDPEGSVRTLHQALRSAAPHARILVRSGTYREPTIVVDRPVTIEGEGWPVFLGGEHEVFRVTADSVAIRGLVIRHVVATAAEDRAAVRFAGVRHCVLEQSRFEDTFFAVYLAKSADCRIAGNRIQGTGTVQGLSGNGIHSWYSRNLTIENNEIRGHRDGIYLEFTAGSVVRGNLSAHNLRYGLHFMFSQGCKYLGNSFPGNGAGVAVMYSDSVIMQRNRFERSWGSAAYGLLLKELRDSQIEHNRFAGNTIGLWTEGTSRTTISRNDFTGNGWAVRVLGDATDNRFTGNRFVGNTFDVGTVAGRNTNVFDANYWDHYQGYDLNRDGYGDVGFQPVRLFSLFVQESEPSLILLHSFFIDLLDMAERVIPSLTPETLIDAHPLMTPANRGNL